MAQDHPHHPASPASKPAQRPTNGERDRKEQQAKALEVGDRRSSRLFYRAVRKFARITLYPLLDVQVTNREALNHPGPLVVAPVHRSHLDSVLIATASKRRLRALGKESLFARSGIAWACAALGAIPVRRGSADRDALSAAKMLLDRGEAMFVFPEGGRISAAVAHLAAAEASEAALTQGNSTVDPLNPADPINVVQPLFDGAAWLAARTGAPVLPVGIAGTAEAFGVGARRLRRTTVRIVVGQPMPAPTGEGGRRVSRQQIHQFTDRLSAELQAAQDEAVRLQGRASQP